MGLDIKTVEILEQELAKNTEILDSIFSNFNLKILNIAYSANAHAGTISVFLEFTTLDGNPKIKNANQYGEIVFKVNFYKENRLLYSCEYQYNAKTFSGYDTISIYANYDNLIEKATTARAFVKKGE